MLHSVTVPLTAKKSRVSTKIVVMGCTSDHAVHLHCIVHITLLLPVSICLPWDVMQHNERPGVIVEKPLYLF